MTGLHPPPAPPRGRGLAWAAGVTAGLSAVGSVGGLVRDQAIAHLFGAGAESDAFLVAWTVPEMAATVLIEDAMALLMVPAFSAVLARGGGARGLVRGTLPKLLALLAALTAALAAAAPYVVDVLAPGLADPRAAVACTRLTALTVLTFGLAGYLSAALRAHRRFVPPAAIYVAYNAGIIATLLALHTRYGIRAAAAGVAVGGLCMVLIQLPAFASTLRATPPPAGGSPATGQDHSAAFTEAAAAAAATGGPATGPAHPIRAGQAATAVQPAAVHAHAAPIEARTAHRTAEPAHSASREAAPEPAADWSAPGGQPATGPSRPAHAGQAATAVQPAAVHAHAAPTEARTAHRTAETAAGENPATGPAQAEQAAAGDRRWARTAETAAGGKGYRVVAQRRADRRLRGEGGRTGVALALLAPVVLFTLGRQAQVLVERFFAAPLPAGAISHLNYAQKVAQLPMALSLMICTVTFPVVSRALAEGDRELARRRVVRDLNLACLVVLAGTAYVLACAPQITHVLFQRGEFDAADTAATAGVMRVYALGLLGQTLVGALIRPYFSAARPTWYPAASMAAGLLVTAVADAAAAGPWGAYGIAAGNAAGISVTAVLLLRGLARRGVDVPARTLAPGLARTAAAALAAAAAGWALAARLPDPPVAAAACALAVPAVFALAAVALRAPEVPYLFAPVLRKGRP
ncbi:lipid II flippase MurJ [Streptomyces sp. V4-01]|uniref:Lipid II flippase MurJ n=1 Tax=Actinacidiphila polyblastidii TaxID=3110430 RepID=A0ABU7P605_9ACTN|nr:lipid II flippase MurJ [Streptomyces sp. V4-01]